MIYDIQLLVESIRVFDLTMNLVQYSFVLLKDMLSLVGKCLHASVLRLAGLRLGWVKNVLSIEEPAIYEVLLHRVDFLVGLGIVLGGSGGEERAAFLEEEDKARIAEADEMREKPWVLDALARDIS